MSSQDTLRINLSTLKENKAEFKQCENKFNNKAYNTFKSSYLNSCGDTYVGQMADELRKLYTKIATGYDEINKWWKNYNEAISDNEKKLISECDTIIDAEKLDVTSLFQSVLTPGNYVKGSAVSLSYSFADVTSKKADNNKNLDKSSIKEDKVLDHIVSKILTGKKALDKVAEQSNNISQNSKNNARTGAKFVDKVADETFNNIQKDSGNNGVAHETKGNNKVSYATEKPIKDVTAGEEVVGEVANNVNAEQEILKSTDVGKVTNVFSSNMDAISNVNAKKPIAEYFQNEILGYCTKDNKMVPIKTLGDLVEAHKSGQDITSVYVGDENGIDGFVNEIDGKSLDEFFKKYS